MGLAEITRAIRFRREAGEARTGRVARGGASRDPANGFSAGSTLGMHLPV